MLNKVENAKKLYIDAGKDLKIHKISKSVTLLTYLVTQKTKPRDAPASKIDCVLNAYKAIYFKETKQA